MLFEHENTLSCHEAQLLMAFYISDDPTLGQDRREAFEAHVRICPSCAAEYEEDRQLVPLLRQYWPVSENAGKPHQAAGHDVEPSSEGLCTCAKPYRPMTVEEGWERLKNDCPSLAEACRRDERKRKLRAFTWPIGGVAAAACVLIAISAGWVMMLKDDSGKARPGIAVNTGGTPVGFAELVTGASRKPLAMNRPFATASQPQEILLGGMHRVVMNRDTEATFSTSASAAAGDGAASSTPQRRQDGQDGQDGQDAQGRQGGQDGHDGKIPYEIQLAHGELYVEVVPGHTFTVRTANARLDITGTKFDVLADGEKTDLTLLKGSVRFTRPAGGGAVGAAEAFVDVPAGHASAIVGQRAPTAPAPVDAVATTAWARGTALSNAVALADGQADADLSDLKGQLGFAHPCLVPWPAEKEPTDRAGRVNNWLAFYFPYFLICELGSFERKGCDNRETYH